MGKGTHSHTGMMGLEFRQELEPVNSYECRRSQFLFSPFCVGLRWGHEEASRASYRDCGKGEQAVGILACDMVCSIHSSGRSIHKLGDTC